MPEPAQQSTEDRTPRRFERVLTRAVNGTARRILSLPKNKYIRAIGSAIDTTMNPVTLQARYLVPGYAKRPLGARPIATRLALGLALLPAATYLAMNLGLALPVTAPLFMALLPLNICYRSLIKKKCETVMEETNEAGQRVSGTREDLCRLALSQKMINGITGRFNKYAVPPPATAAVDAIHFFTRSRRGRVTVIDAGDNGAGGEFYEFAGDADSRSSMKKVAVLMTEGTARPVRVIKPLRFKGDRKI